MHSGFVRTLLLACLFSFNACDLWFLKDNKNIVDMESHVYELERTGQYPELIQLRDRQFQLALKMGRTSASIAANQAIHLAEAYLKVGLTSAAEPLFYRAIELQKKHDWPSKSSINLGRHFTSLAGFCERINLPREAKIYYETAKKIYEENGFNSDSLDYSENSLALPKIYLADGDYEKAASLLNSLLKQVPIPIKKDPYWEWVEVARFRFEILHNLGKLYYLKNDYFLSEQYLLHALRTLDEYPAVKKIGFLIKDTSLLLLSRVYCNSGDQLKSREIIDQVQLEWNLWLYGIDESIINAYKLKFLNLLRYEAKSWLVSKCPENAFFFFAKSVSFEEWQIQQISLLLADDRLSAFLESTEEQANLIYTLAAQNINRPYAELAIKIAWLRKSRTAIELALLSSVAQSSLLPECRLLLEELRTIQNYIANRSLWHHNDSDQDLKQWKRREDIIWQRLTKISTPLRMVHQNKADPDVLLNHVKQKLSARSGLLEVVVYKPMDLKTVRPRHPEELHYLAFTLTTGSGVIVKDLGPITKVDNLVRRLVHALSDPESHPEAPAKDLYDAIFKPLLPAIGKIRHVEVALDGELHRVPFSALHDGNDYLAEAWQFSYHWSGRELAAKPEKTTSSNKFIVLAHAAFDDEPAMPFVSHLPSLLRRESRAGLEPVEDLPRTEDEAHAIRSLYPKAILLLGRAATAAAFLHVQAPAVLHVATHGMFISRDDEQPEAEASDIYSSSRGRKLDISRMQSPLVRSFLILAGYNRWLLPKPSSKDQRADYSALVSALEMGSMNLKGTQLVVLSACETGRGEVHPGQGTYGLSRAALIAGAETVVTSLWAANDAATAQLMAIYYQKLKEGRGRVTALSMASCALKKRYHHPYFWAPFIGIGQDAPLMGVD